MTRYKITIEYDGSYFWGWQAQNEFPTVQQTIKEVIYHLTQEHVVVEGAGRTDRGVHATGQVAHFDLEKYRRPHLLLTGLNHFLLPQHISITKVEEVSDTFHARFDAKNRTYLYRILNRSAPSALDVNRAWLVRAPLDINLLQAGANLLLGKHDFTSFRASECQAANSIKTLDVFQWQHHGDELRAIIQSRSFLHNQVRIMVGTLYEIGIGKKPISWVEELLNAKKRSIAGRTAPAHGLYLRNIEY